MNDAKILGIELVQESSRFDSFSVLESAIEDNDGELLMEMCEELDVLDADLVYNEEMVPIFKINNDYLVEHENLVKLILYYEQVKGISIDEEQALEKLCECGENIAAGMVMENTYIVMESDEAYRRQVFNISEKIKKEKDARKKQSLKIKLSTMKERFRRMKENNRLKLLKKKNPGKPAQKAPGKQVDNPAK